MTKIAVIGIGYWGNIIHKSLLKLYPEQEIVTCDSMNPKADYISYESLYDNNMDIEKVYIATPVSTHYEISKYFLNRGISVFCEKPLVENTYDYDILNKIADQNDAVLYTDWIFTHNSGIEYIHTLYNEDMLGEILNVTMNRLNINHDHVKDTNARWDMGSHDVSIVYHLFDRFGYPKIFIKDYSKNRSNPITDSSLIVLTYPKFTVTINASWKYARKNRECAFEFEKYYVLWDDLEQIVRVLNKDGSLYKSYCYKNELPPLSKSILYFNSLTKNSESNNELTKKVIRTLNEH